jgi:hypothetical protein
LLGFQTPLAEGRVLGESFYSLIGQNRKQALTAVEKEAVKLQKLAERNLNQALVSNLLTNRTLTNLAANAETTVLTYGLIDQIKGTNRMLSPEQNVMMTRAVQDWLNRPTGDSGNLAIIYRLLVALKMNPAWFSSPDKSDQPDLDKLPRIFNELISADSSQIKPVDKAFATMLLARLAAAPNRKNNGNTMQSAVSDPLKMIDKLLDSFTTPTADIKVAPHQEALIMYALSDTLLTLESLNSLKLTKGKPALPASENANQLSAIMTKLKLRQITLLHYYRVIAAQPELGGLWPDPIDSMLYLVAAERLETVGLFREFRSLKQLTAGKKQNEKPALPECVMNLPLEQLAVWLDVKGQNLKVREPQLRMKFTTAIWERNHFLNFSREQTRYLVDENGRITGDNQALAAGSFLSL